MYIYDEYKIIGISVYDKNMNDITEKMISDYVYKKDEGIKGDINYVEDVDGIVVMINDYCRNSDSTYRTYESPYRPFDVVNEPENSYEEQRYEEV